VYLPMVVSNHDEDYDVAVLTIDPTRLEPAGLTPQEATAVLQASIVPLTVDLRVHDLVRVKGFPLNADSARPEVIEASVVDLQLPLPGKGNAPLHLCPVDFVIDAAYLLSRVPTTVSKTFHLTDPSPLSARSVYQLVAERAHRRAPRGGSLPLGLARALLRLPGLARLGGSPQAVLEGFTHNVFYNCRNTLDALRNTPIWCPPLESYVDNLVRYVKDVRAARRRRIDEEAPDPLDGSQVG